MKTTKATRGLFWGLMLMVLFLSALGVHNVSADLPPTPNVKCTAYSNSVWKVVVSDEVPLYSVDIDLWWDAGKISNNYHYVGPPFPNSVTANVPMITDPDQWYYVKVTTLEVTTGGSTIFPETFFFKIDNQMLISLVSSNSTAAGVGGNVVPVDKFGLLAPYISLASAAIIAAAVATTIYVKRRKKQ